MEWERVLDHAPWGARAMPRGGLMDGYFYVLSGRTGMFGIYGDTWRSPDGITWELMSDRTGWGRRCYPEVEIIDGHLILMGGQDLRTFHNDVWRSADQGRTWEQVCERAPWDVRAGHHTFTIAGEILLFGGARNSFNRTFYPELWVSTDLGETWELRAELPTDMGRAGMQVVEVVGTLYFMGGDHDRPVFKANWPGRRNDVWKSEDRGQSWELLGHAPWAARTGHQCIAHEEKTYCLGGHIRGPRDQRFRQFLASDLWVWDPVASGEGMEGWELVSDDAWGGANNLDLEGKSDFLLEVRDGQLWTFGGDREVLSPWPQDHDVWTAQLPASSSFN